MENNQPELCTEPPAESSYYLRTCRTSDEQARQAFLLIGLIVKKTALFSSLKSFTHLGIERPSAKRFFNPFIHLLVGCEIGLTVHQEGLPIEAGTGTLSSSISLQKYRNKGIVKDQALLETGRKKKVASICELLASAIVNCKSQYCTPRRNHTSAANSLCSRCTGKARLQIWILVSCSRDPKLEMAGKNMTRHPWNVMQPREYWFSFLLSPM
eukprot:scaffold48881_cov62-Attheya_sp.AAC.1